MTTDLYTSLDIIRDDSNGLIQLGIAERLHENRKTKLVNNFVGLLKPADSSTSQQLAKLLSEKIGDLGETVIVGMHKSGIVAATLLACARGTAFSWTTPDLIAGEAISYFEDHRSDKAHHLYGVTSGDRVIIVEDEVTSGKGVAGMARVLREHGVTVVAIASFVETINFGAAEHIFRETGLNLISLVQVRLRD